MKQKRKTPGAILLWMLLVCVGRLPRASHASGPPQCGADLNRDGRVTIDEIISAVDDALQGCALVPRVSLEGVEIHELQTCFEQTNPLHGAAGTIALEITPQAPAQSDQNYAIASLYTPNQFGPQIALFRNGLYLRLLSSDDMGSESNIGVRIDGWAAREAHTVIASWGSGVASLAIDGQPAWQIDVPHPITFGPGACFAVGRLPDSTISAAATFRHVHLYEGVVP
jgi:hypothetical protein